MMARVVRIVGTLMIVAGFATLAWAFAVWRWEDPFTSLYTTWKQRSLSSSYKERAAAFHGDRAPALSIAAARRAVKEDAARYRKLVKRGEAIGRIKVQRLGVDMVFVNGTDTEPLKRGPGRDPRTYMPGQGELVYIAGHRTTYGAPFSRIDTMKPGDRVTLELPYATFVYQVTGHRIVASTEISVLESKGREVLALQACHPRFFATHRWIVYAKPIRIISPSGQSYSLVSPTSVAAPSG